MRHIAVIIPAHNEEQVILNTLRALQAAGFCSRDIYVVDDCSKDRTSEIVRCFVGVNLLTLTENVGKANALRKLIRHFILCERYQWVAFLDVDTEVDENFLTATENAISADPSVALYIGQIRAKVGGYLSSLRVVEYAISQDLFKSGMSRQGVLFVAPGCSSIYNTGILRHLRFEGDTLAEDMDLTIQVQRLRGKIIYIPDAIVYTQDPMTIKDYIKQVTRWYRGTWQVLKKYRTLSFTKKQKVDYWIIFLMIDALAFNRVIWLLGATVFLAMSQVLMLFGFDVAFYFAFATYAALKTKRFDVIYRFPAYFWTSYLNPLLFFRAFGEIVLLKKHPLAWNKVQRY